MFGVCGEVFGVEVVCRFRRTYHAFHRLRLGNDDNDNGREVLVDERMMPVTRSRVVGVCLDATLSVAERNDFCRHDGLSRDILNNAVEFPTSLYITQLELLHKTMPRWFGKRRVLGAVFFFPRFRKPFVVKLCI